MKYLLDTNAIAALWKKQPCLVAHIRRHSVSDFGVPSIVSCELYFGALRSDFVNRNLARIESMQFEVVPFDSADARQAAEIRAVLARAGTPIGPHDILIAGRARARNLVLISRNLREFGRVDGLRAEDWES